MKTTAKTIQITRDHLLLDGRPLFCFGGDFNYSRTPRRHWRDRLLKMKAAGLNTVTFYLTWAFHEPVRDRWNFAGDADAGAFLDLIHELGLYAITRLGPFVHGEWINGGLPQWLVDELGPQRCRTNDPEYLRLTGLWYEKVLGVVIPRQVTRGGAIVMMQLENELGSAGSKGDDIPRGSADPDENRKHVLHYYHLVKQAGLEVPIIDISHWSGREEAIAELVDTGGGYPSNYFGCDGEVWGINKERWEKHQRPLITIETGGGMSQRLFDLPPYRNTRGYQGPIIGPEVLEAMTIGHLVEGASGVNYYVFADGQHPTLPGGVLAGERMLPPRDMNYQAPITVVGSLRESYRWMKRLGWMLRAFDQEMLGAKPNYTWARAMSYGKAHPGVEQTGDLFEGYHAEAQVAQGLEQVKHVAEVESAGRCTRGLNLSETNFLFLRNTKIHGARWLRDIRVETNARGIPCETSREYPKHIQLSLPPQRNKILPFYLRLQPRTFLEYSTGELLDRRPFGVAADQVILYADADEMFETAIVTEKQCAVTTHGECLPMWDSPCTLNLIGRPGATMQISVLETGPRPLRIVHLERELAGQVWDVDSPDGPVVAISTAALLDGGQKIQTDRSDFSLWLLTPREPRITGATGTYDAVFGLYEATGTLPVPVKTIAWTKRRNGGRLTWEADVTPALLDDTRDVVVHAQYQGACGRAYLGDTLISDHYIGRFLMWEIGLRDWLHAPGQLRLEFDDTLDATVEVRSVVECELKIEWPS